MPNCKYDRYIFDLDGTLLDTLQDLAASVNYALKEHGMPTHTVDNVRRFVGNGVRRLMERAVPNGADNPDFDDTFATFRQYYMQHSLDTTRPYDGIPELIRELSARGCQLAVVSNKMMAATQELVRHFFPEIPVAIGENEAAGIRRKPAPDTVYEALRQLDARPAPSGRPSAPSGCPSAPSGRPSAPSGCSSAFSGRPSALSGRPSSPSGCPSAFSGRPSAASPAQFVVGGFAADASLPSAAPSISASASSSLPSSAPLSAVYVGDSDVDLQTARNAGLPCISVLWGFRDRDFLLAHGATTFASRPQDILEI